MLIGEQLADVVRKEVRMLTTREMQERLRMVETSSQKVVKKNGDVQ